MDVLIFFSPKQERRDKIKECLYVFIPAGKTRRKEEDFEMFQALDIF
jgi:hypothetical protein